MEDTIEPSLSDTTDSVQADEAGAGVRAAVKAQARRYDDVTVSEHVIPPDLPATVHPSNKEAVLAFLDSRLNELVHADSQQVDRQLALIDERRREDDNITQRRAREDREMSQTRARQDEQASQRRKEEDASLASQDEQTVWEEVVVRMQLRRVKRGISGVTNPESAGSGKRMKMLPSASNVGVANLRPSRNGATTNFPKERKWRLAAIRGVAEWGTEFVASSKEERLTLRIRVRRPRVSVQGDADVVMEDGPGPALALVLAMPKLIPSAEDGSVDDGMLANLRAIADARRTILSLGASGLMFTIDRTPASENLLNEFPLCQPADVEPDFANSDLAERLDTRWKQNTVPTSSFATEEIGVVNPELEHPAKPSRFHYVPDSPVGKESRPLAPKQNDVALFQPKNKDMRNRIHHSNSVRPPSDHPMPPQSFFESRSSSHWTHTEDDELRRLVKDYSYNWSLVSSCLTTRSMFSSGADRRTPWECFERWIGLEGLPADLTETPFFRAYHTRIEAAEIHIQAHLEAAQECTGANVQTNQERTAQPVSVGYKRTRENLTMLSAMRKLASRRKTEMQNQQRQAYLATSKANEPDQRRLPVLTRAELSSLRHEREVKLLERHEIDPRQLIAHRRGLAAQRSNQVAQADGLPNCGPWNASGVPDGPLATSMGGTPNAGLRVPPGHQRPNSTQRMSSDIFDGLELPPGMAGSTTCSLENQARLRAEAVRVQQQQIIAQRNAQQHVRSRYHSLPNLCPQQWTGRLMVSIDVSFPLALIAAETSEPVANRNTMRDTSRPTRDHGCEPQAAQLKQGRPKLFIDKFHHCEALDNYGRGMWRCGKDNGAGTRSSHQVYILCHHEQCGRMNWKTIHGFRCHVTRCHKEGRLPKTVDSILERYGVSVAAIREQEANTQAISAIADHHETSSLVIPAQAKDGSGRDDHNLLSANLGTWPPGTAWLSDRRVTAPKLLEMLRLFSQSNDSGFVEGEIEA